MKNNQSLFTVTYSDLTTYEGGDLLDTHWNNILKPILNIEYRLYSRKIFLQGYDTYNHVVEVCADVMGTHLNSKIERVFLMARKDLEVTYFIFNMKTKMLSVKRSVLTKQFEGWKEGISGQIIRKIS